MLVQIIDFFFAAEGMVTGEGDDLLARGEDEECHVETNLVVACACASVGDGVGSNLVGITGDGDSLEDALGRNGDGVAIVSKNVAKDHVLQ